MTIQHLSIQERLHSHSTREIDASADSQEVINAALVEKHSEQFRGSVWRCERMTREEALARNAKIETMQWEEVIS